MKCVPAALCILLGSLTQAAVAADIPQAPLIDLGRALFFDPNLSANRQMSCASCHDPAKGFTDPDTNRLGGAVSLGANGTSFGDRNAPTVSYAAFSPAFHRAGNGEYVGGQFWDGRAATLADQAMGPPVNPGEMDMPDMAAVRERLLENPDYVTRIRKLFGEQAMDTPLSAYNAMARSIAAFEKAPEVSPFDSKYDRYLRGEYRMTEQEELGRTLFFSQQFTNCSQCHQLRRSSMDRDETFTNYQYRNIGVPVNRAVREANGSAAGYVDPGLLNNPNLIGMADRGRFKIPTLRNVAVTGPYMHNGVFNNLETVIRFYNHYNSKSPKNRINPETGRPWGKPEVKANLALKELKNAPPLDERRIKALVAFLKTLTDKRYERLLAVQQASR